jgi:probable phosphoglycerate mutase
MSVGTELVITRHGEAICNTQRIVGGDKGCTGLSEHGRTQTIQLADHLHHEHQQHPFDVLYASPRLRTHQSGLIISQTLALPLLLDRELRAPDHGDADGQPWDEVKTSFEGPPQAHPERPHAPGAEPWYDYLARVTGRLVDLLKIHDGARILIAAHGETIEAAHGLILGLPPDACTRLSFRTDHASISRWEHHTNRFGRRVWMLATHNDTAHLTS